MGRKRNTGESASEESTVQEREGAVADSAGEESPAADGRAAQLEAELAEMKDRYLRAMADMDNIRRRSRMEAEDARKFANERLVTDLLPILDNFNRALSAADQSESVEALRSGVELIHRQLQEVLTRSGLQRIEAVGQPFDPNLHEAIMQVEPEEGQEPHQVVEELQAGYRFNDRVVRPTLVKVTSG